MSTEIKTLNGYPIADTALREQVKNAPVDMAVADIAGGSRITINYANGSSKTVDVMDGEDGDPGDPGRGIKSITQTSGNGAAGTTDTYTITYNDGTTGTFTVTNGAKGDTGDAWYVWIRYAGQQPTQDSDIGTTPDNWMGVYSGTSSTAPTHYTDYQWFQIKGAKGDTGNPAIIQSTAIEYQASSSGTTVPSGTWSTTIPVVTQGQYLWTRTTVTFNSGSPVVWYGVSYIAVDGTGSPGTATPLVDSGSGAVGVAMAYSRQDHQHPLNVASTGTPQMDGTASRGSESTYARSDHTHPANTNKQDKITSSGMLKGNGSGGVSAATKGVDYGAKSFTITLASASWSNNAQTVSNADFYASGYSYIVSPAGSSFSDYAAAVIYADDVTVDGSMTFHCTNVPTNNLTVNVQRSVSA